MTLGHYLSFLTLGSLSFRFIRLWFAIRSSRRGGRGQRSFGAIFWVMTSAYLLYVFFCTKEAFSRLSSFSIPISIVGLFIFIFALLLREKAMADLGRFFSPDIEIRQKHQLIQDGLYRYVRHPLLLCMALEILGFGLATNAFVSLTLFGIGVYFPLIGLRMWLEERTLRHSLGDVYEQYRQQVGAFWPRGMR